MTNKPESTSLTLGKWKINRPGGMAIFLTVLLVGICLVLGIWQVQRLQWKEALIAQLQVANEAPPIEGAALPLEEKALQEFNFRKVTLTGVFMDDREFHLIGRYYQGALGYDVLTPFYLTGSSRVILVNRGWIPLEKKNPSTRPEPLENPGETKVEGMLFIPNRGNYFLPDHDVKGNVWFWYDIARMNKEAGLDMPNIIVEAVEVNHPESRLPYPRADYEITLRNDHFYYAVTWFSLALAGIIIFLLAHRKKRNYFSAIGIF